MIALAIIFLLLAAALVVGIIVTGTSQEVVLDSTVGTFTTQPVWIFVAGVVAALLTLLGLSALGRGTRRRVDRRREMKRLRRVEEEQAARHESDRETEREVERNAERDAAVPADRAAAGEPVGAREGYDEPDRHLVRGSRSTTGYDPAAGEHVRQPADGTTTPPTTTTRGTADHSADPLDVDEAARHRQP